MRRRSLIASISSNLNKNFKNSIDQSKEDISIDSRKSKKPRRSTKYNGRKSFTSNMPTTSNGSNLNDNQNISFSLVNCSGAKSESDSPLDTVVPGTTGKNYRIKQKLLKVWGLLKQFRFEGHLSFIEKILTESIGQISLLRMNHKKCLETGDQWEQKVCLGIESLTTGMDSLGIKIATRKTEISDQMNEAKLNATTDNNSNEIKASNQTSSKENNTNNTYSATNKIALTSTTPTEINKLNRTKSTALIKTTTSTTVMTRNNSDGNSNFIDELKQNLKLKSAKDALRMNDLFIERLAVLQSSIASDRSIVSSVEELVDTLIESFENKDDFKKRLLGFYRKNLTMKTTSNVFIYELLEIKRIVYSAFNQIQQEKITNSKNKTNHSNGNFSILTNEHFLIVHKFVNRLLKIISNEIVFGLDL